jgi:2-hydroxy-6-oxonona-2,4-dienedioate hydrolase
MSIFKEPLYNQSYIDTGVGKPIILLHGLFGNIAMWRSTINALKNQYRVVVPRLPIFEVPMHRANMNSLVEILHEFLDWNQLTDVCLIGTDMGAQLALDYAHRYEGRVKKIIISGSSGLFENSPIFEKDFNKDYDTVKSHVSDLFYNKNMIGSAVVNKVFETVNIFSKGLKISAFSKASKENEITNFLYKLDLPVLMIWGLQGEITPPTVALHFHDLLKFGTVKFIDECGHLPMVEKPGIYNQTVLDFIY